MSRTVTALPDDAAALKALVRELQASLYAHDLLVRSLRAQIARLKKQKFGASSEKIAREIEQLELTLEGLEIAKSETSDEPPSETDTAASDAPADDAGEERRKRRRPRVPPDTPRDRHELDPGETCPDCGGALRLVGEDVSEILDLIAAQLKIIEVARLKKSCRCCEKMVQCPAPSRPVAGSMAGPGLLSFILVSKFDDHLPLYRLSEIFARQGADIPDTTLADWCGRAMRVLKPLSDLIGKEVLASNLLHVDDTPIRVLDRAVRQGELGKGVSQGRIWTYIRDQRPWAGPAPPGAVYFFSPDRKGEHPQRHLKDSAGILQADAYTGFKELYRPGPGVEELRFQEAACWAHLRRDFHDVWTSEKSEIAREALDRIGALYDIEAKIHGRSAEERLAVRQAHSKPHAEAFRAWAEEQLKHISGKSDLAQAFRYALRRWSSFCLFLEDGRVAIDNNAAERGLRPIGVGRRNWLFAGSHAGGETMARALTLIESAKLNGLNPQAYLTDVLARINDHKINRLDELLPWKWKPASPVAANKLAA